jgi:hypothetical protein
MKPYSRHNPDLILIFDPNPAKNKAKALPYIEVAAGSSHRLIIEEKKLRS